MNPLHDIVMSANIVVCVGAGGVGKTTTSAVLALHAALHGRRTLVLTIDPARRLANSLGLEGLGHDERQISLEEFMDPLSPSQGQLWAMMLDMKSAFDNVVRRNAENDEMAERILENKYYYYFSSSLAGTQDYSAVESLAEIYEEGRYDLIVLDTPPTQHALDFLDAPIRLNEALSNSALQWLYRPSLASGKLGLGLFKLGAKYIRRTLGRFTGGTMLDDLAVFLESVSPLLGEFNERAGKVLKLMHDPSTVFFVVTSPDPLTVDESIYFDKKLQDEEVRFGGYIVNRVHLPAAEAGVELPNPEEVVEKLGAIPGSSYIGRRGLERLARGMLQNARDFGGIAEKDDQMLDLLSKGHHVNVLPIPFYANDIYSLKGIERVRKDLFGDSSRARTVGSWSYRKVEP